MLFFLRKLDLGLKNVILIKKRSVGENVEVNRSNLKSADALCFHLLPVPPDAVPARDTSSRRAPHVLEKTLLIGLF